MTSLDFTDDTVVAAPVGFNHGITFLPSPNVPQGAIRVSKHNRSQSQRSLLTKVHNGVYFYPAPRNHAAHDMHMLVRLETIHGEQLFECDVYPRRDPRVSVENFIFGADLPSVRVLPCQEDGVMVEFGDNAADASGPSGTIRLKHCCRWAHLRATLTVVWFPRGPS